MVKKMKQWVNDHKAQAQLAACTMGAPVMLAAGTLAGAAEGDFNLATTMTTVVQTCVTDIMGMVGAILPVGVTVLAASIGITYGYKLIKRIIKP